MLSRLTLTNFKCFESIDLSLRPCTLLTGRNASGKSTIMQALVLLHQSAVDAEWRPELLLNGSVIRLGTAADVIDKISGHRSCGIALHTDDTHCKWTFRSDDRHALTLSLHQVSCPVEGDPLRHYQPSERNAGAIRWLVPRDWSQLEFAVYQLLTRIRDLQYLSAERIGPRESYPLTDASLRNVGAFGENAAALIYWFGDERVTSALRLPDATPVVRDQVQARMRTFFPDSGFDVQRIANANLVSLRLRTSDSTDFHRPQHVGFGLSHVFPIITAALIAKPGELLLVENPESHLHPAGQSEMGRFLAHVASSGVQVMIETHSDHIINGVRKAVRKTSLRPEHLAIYFFNERAASDRSQVVSIEADAQGNFDHWPNGFFDQVDKDTAFLAGWED